MAPKMFSKTHCINYALDVVAIYTNYTSKCIMWSFMLSGLNFKRQQDIEKKQFSSSAVTTQFRYFSFLFCFACFIKVKCIYSSAK